MAVAQLGQKHLCFSCASKFYDLGRAELVCPKCGSNQDEAPAKVDMSTIAAKVMASVVQESEPTGDTGAPLADDMDIFGGEMHPDGKKKSASHGELETDETEDAEFGDDEEDF